MLAALKVAVIAPAAEVNRTVMLHVWPGPRLAAEQASAVTANAAGSVSVTVSGPVAAWPELVSVNACVAVCPGGTLPSRTEPG